MLTVGISSIAIVMTFVLGPAEGHARGNGARGGCFGAECKTTICVTEECKKTVLLEERQERKFRQEESSSSSFINHVASDYKCFCRPRPAPAPSGNIRVENDITIILNKIIKIEQRMDLFGGISDSIQNLRNEIMALLKIQFGKIQNALEVITAGFNNNNSEIKNYHHDVQVVLQIVDKLPAKLTEIVQLIIKNSRPPPVNNGIDINTINDIIQKVSINIKAMFADQTESLTALQFTVTNLEKKVQVISTALAAVMEKVQWIVKYLKAGSGRSDSCIQKEIQQILIIEQELSSIVNVIVKQVTNNGQMISTLITEGGNQQGLQDIIVICQALKADLMKLSRVVTKSFSEYRSQFTKTTTMIESFSKVVQGGQEQSRSGSLSCTPGSFSINSNNAAELMQANSNAELTQADNDNELKQTKDKIDPDQESNED